MRAQPLPRYSPTLFRHFGRYVGWYLRRHFHAVRIARNLVPTVPAGRPLIVYSNHPSWWDPLLFILLCATVFPQRRGFGPMDARALARYRILERVGVFGIDLDERRGAARFFDVSRRLLENPAHMLWITAEGEFTDARRRPIRLRPGLGHLARAIPAAVVVPLAVEYTFWNESRPELLCRFGEPMDLAQLKWRAATVAECTARFEGALTVTLDALAADSEQRDPALFLPLVRGASGVGGVYDVWRRLMSWRRGAHFERSHEGAE